ncbi:MAG: hypothetical protein Q8L48_38440 [Archangium sp.]|nr:hypothetical protein [Archangium sp.]
MIRLFSVVVFAAVLRTGACNPVDVAIDCHAICARYQTCFDKAYDLGKCETSCREHATTDDKYRHRADECSACIDDRTCAGAVFKCAGPCTTVVP